MSLLSRDEILAVDDRPTQTVEVPEWGGSVIVRGLTGAERDAYEVGMVSRRPDGSVRGTNLANLRGRLVAMACVGEDGKRIFTDADAAALGEKSGAAMERVFQVASRLSGLTEADVKELAEGFEDAPSEDFTSA